MPARNCPSLLPRLSRIRPVRSPRARHLVALGCAALVLTVAPPAQAGAAGPAIPVAPPGLRVLTDNVMFLPPIVANYANGARADLIARSAYVRGYDVVVFQELFQNGPSSRLLAGLADRYPYQTPVIGRSRSGWDRTAGHYRDLKPEDGGVAVLSRWPITKRVQYVYRDGCGTDWFSNKGFAYVVLDVAGTPVHVFGTHTQSEDTLCADGQPAKVRASQFGELNAFIDAQHIPAGQPVIIAGDLNVIRQSPELGSMLGALDAAAPESFAGHPFSFDPATNGIAGERYPGSDREHLDYVLLRNGHAGPAGWVNQTIFAKAPAWSMTRLFRTYTYTDFSDHYPVAGFSAGS